MPIHFAQVAESPRLQRIVRFLRERGERGATTWEIVAACYSPNVATYVSELNHQGYSVTCTREGTSKAAVYRYRLVSEPRELTLSVAETEGRDAGPVTLGIVPVRQRDLFG